MIELNRIGGNVNQLTRLANTTPSPRYASNL